jgi:hypothetical protein
MSMRKAVLFSLFITMLYFCSLTFARAEDASPYGGYKKGPEETGYGEKRPVTTVEEARKALTEYFKKKDVKIGEIREQELFFEAEIRDKGNNLVDKVIVDKRTGRIRSTY